ncbi:MBL fold metallo-hydrolase [Parashewanella tropica]|uniref:MBL fold metallo-hydrolase n=1 Tax=Parashewanella tropica TaxID=2547970 RepID=UPI00105A52FD|nr:MBL fold metallo-hydrolase [Parashewanella tropica]
MTKTPFTITRINNACVLISIGEHHILTDPYFLDVSFIGITELAAIEVKDLPPLTAILGCHDVTDHWQMEGLVDYPHDKDDVTLFVAMDSQVITAKEAGFSQVEVLEWGEKRTLGANLIIESVEGQNMLKWTVNNYVIRLGATAIFFGGEARDLSPLAEYYKNNGSVDIAILPVNGVHLMSYYQLVMTAKEAVEATKLLGAKQLFTIHDAHRPIPFFININSSGEDAEIAASKETNIEVIRMPTGQVWSNSSLSA